MSWRTWLLCAPNARRAPDVLSRDEVWRLLRQLGAPHQLIASLLYGASLRLFEGQRLRAKDGDFEGGVLPIRAGKGDKDRVTVLNTPVKLAKWHSKRWCRFKIALGMR